MVRAPLGFDEELDRSAPETRRQAGLRLVIAVLLFVTARNDLPLAGLLVWAAMFAVGDGVLWLATHPDRVALRSPVWRGLRLAASHLSTWAWVTISALWWFAPGPYGEAVAVALLAGVLLYVVRGCHRSLAQLLATGVPPLLALAVLPFTEPDAGAAGGLFAAVGLLVAYSVSSGLNAWGRHRALQAASAALRAKQREAEAANVAKSEFLANMSHEIRTPLNGVLAMAHVLGQSDLPGDARECVRLILSSGEALERIVSEILDLAKVESGALQLEQAPFSPAALVREVGGLFRAAARDKGLELAVDIAPAADGLWLGDAHRVRQVLTNLVSNAVKFTDAGEVRLGLAPGRDGGLSFVVADTGVGFDAEQKARLFERFQQADGSITRSRGGTGLGLAISRGLAEAMGGTLDADSAPGRGSAFRFEAPLPRAAAPAPEAEAAAAAGAAAEPAGPALRVLAADDHAGNRKVVEIILAGAGLEAVSVENGREAVEALAAGAYDLVLMDMQMPVMDGLAAVAEIRRLEAQVGGRRIPILMLTASGLQEHVEAGRAAGADGHLTKPVNPAALLQAIREAVAARPAEAPWPAEAAGA